MGRGAVGQGAVGQEAVGQGAMGPGMRLQPEGSASRREPAWIWQEWHMGN